MSIRYKDVIVPLDVPFYSRGKYILNYLNLTQRSGRLMLFAGDQKIEHLNGDFYGKGIHLNDADFARVRASVEANGGFLDDPYIRFAGTDYQQGQHAAQRLLGNRGESGKSGRS